MSHLELWLSFLVCCQLKQFGRAPPIDGGSKEGVRGPRRRGPVGRASVIAINHQVKIFLHHRALSFRPKKNYLEMLALDLQCFAWQVICSPAGFQSETFLLGDCVM